jgi:hypothetical protein
MSLFLIFFNDPLFPLTVMLPNTVTPIIGVINVSNFLVVLLLFWKVSLYRSLYENGSSVLNSSND